MTDQTVVEKIKGNAYGQHAESINFSLPQTTITMVRIWARDHNFNTSRAINELLWLGYAKYRDELEENGKHKKRDT
jgi:hypothetical protein